MGLTEQHCRFLDGLSDSSSINVVYMLPNLSYLRIWLLIICQCCCIVCVFCFFCIRGNSMRLYLLLFRPSLSVARGLVSPYVSLAILLWKWIHWLLLGSKEQRAWLNYVVDFLVRSSVPPWVAMRASNSLLRPTEEGTWVGWRGRGR